MEKFAVLITNLKEFQRLEEWRLFNGYDTYHSSSYNSLGLPKFPFYASGIEEYGVSAYGHEKAYMDGYEFITFTCFCDRMGVAITSPEIPTMVTFLGGKIKLTQNDNVVELTFDQVESVGENLTQFIN